MRRLGLMCAVVLAAFVAPAPVACSSPAPHVEHCLACAEAVTRLHEGSLCAGVFEDYWDPVLQCRCASQAPCFGQCPAWCTGSVAEASCEACTGCDAQLAACAAH